VLGKEQSILSQMMKETEEKKVLIIYQLFAKYSYGYVKICMYTFKGGICIRLTQFEQEKLSYV
jgi:hypothetical protein